MRDFKLIKAIESITRGYSSRVSLTAFFSFKLFLWMMSLFFFSMAQANIESYFNQIKNNPNALYAFFKKMPKGGELHYHLSGGVYPETMLKLASKGDYCLDTRTWIVRKNQSNCNGIKTQVLTAHPEIYAKTIKNWSLMDFIPGQESTHDHFFNTFYKFDTLITDYQPQLVANVVKTAAQQNEQYMELMILPDNASSARFGDLLKNTSSFSKKRKLLLANKDFQNNINHTATEANRIMQEARRELKCDAKQENRACQLKVKFIYYSLREQSLNRVFAQTLNAFEAVAQSIKNKGVLIGVNLVQAEDGIISLRDYQKHMQIYSFLHQLYPQVNISLHAGEITQEIVPPTALKNHIHDALFIGQAQRVGHGVDIAFENKAQETLNYMASQHKAVEINLTSSKKILNVFGQTHPLLYYLQHQVPVVLSTDDEGILRTNLSAQYLAAVLEHHLDYQSLKRINRNTLTYSFLPGKSIWANEVNGEYISECLDLNSNSCKKFITTSEKAHVQWILEQKLQFFENQFDK